MIGGQVGAHALAISLGMWCLLGLVAILWLAADRPLARLALRHKGRLTATVVLGALLLFPWGGAFDGMEYEDAYEYRYAGLLLQEARALPGFLNTVCLFGRIDDCHVASTLSHPIGYSALLAAVYEAAGYHHGWANYVSLIATIGGLVALFLSGVLILGDATGGVATVLVWLSTPSFVGLATTSFSEPVAASLVSLSLLASARFLSEAGPTGHPRRALLAGLCTALLVGVGTLVRRETMALAGLLLVGLCVGRAKRAGPLGWRGLIAWPGSSWVLAMAGVLAFVVALLGKDLALSQRVHPDRPNFDLMNVALLFRPLLELLGTVNVYGATGLLLLVGIPASFAYSGRLRVPLLLAAGYGVLILTFSQGFYFVEEATTPWLHLERYLLQVSGPLSLVGAGGLLWLMRLGDRRLGPRRLVALAAIASIALGLSARTSVARLTDLRREEAEVRLDPVKKACALIGDGVVITIEPIIWQTICPRADVLDYGLLGSEIGPAALADLTAKERVYYSEGWEREPGSTRRFRTQRDALAVLLDRAKTVGNGTFGGRLLLLPRDIEGNRD
jgi:hypothetical protein